MKPPPKGRLGKPLTPRARTLCARILRDVRNTTRGEIKQKLLPPSYARTPQWHYRQAWMVTLQLGVRTPGKRQAEEYFCIRGGVEDHYP